MFIIIERELENLFHPVRPLSFLVGESDARCNTYNHTHTYTHRDTNTHTHTHTHTSI